MNSKEESGIIIARSYLFVRDDGLDRVCHGVNLFRVEFFLFPSDPHLEHTNANRSRIESVERYGLFH